MSLLKLCNDYFSNGWILKSGPSWVTEIRTSDQIHLRLHIREITCWKYFEFYFVLFYNGCQNCDVSVII